MPMIANAYCNACLMDRRINDYPANASNAAVAEYQRRVREIVEDHPEWSSPEKDYEISHSQEMIFGPVTDFAPIKRHFNALLMDMEPLMLRGVREADDPLRRAVQYAMTGNFIDFAAMDSVDESKLQQLILESDRIPIAEDVLAALRRAVAGAKKLTYILDNCGEIVMDRVLMQTLRALNPSMAITAVVKGAPIVNDATREDAEQARLDEIASRVADTGCGVAGCPENRMSAEGLDALNGADVLIAKGQANYETLCGCGRDLFYIFMCKCQLFMDRFGVPRFSGILARETGSADGCQP